MKSSVINRTLCLMHLIFIGVSGLYSQGVSFRYDQQAAHNSAIFDIQSITGGFLLPRLSSVQRNNIGEPAEGLLVYDQTLKRLYNYSSASWCDIRVGTADSLWTLTNGKLFFNEGRVGIGTSAPATALHIKSQAGTANMRLQNRNASGGSAALFLNTPLSNWRLELTDSDRMQFVNTATNQIVMSVAPNGNVGVGGAPGSEKLYVNGNIRADDHFHTGSLISSGDINAVNGSIYNKMTILSPDANTGGRLRVYGPSGYRIANLSFLSGSPNNGFVEIFHDNESRSARIWVDADGLGKINVEEMNLKSYQGIAQSSTAGAKMDIIGSNGKLNVKLSFVSGYPKHGFIGVYDANGNQQAAMYVDSDGDGVITGDVKNFVEKHPNDPSKEIWYASVEGPELAAYCRGTAQLINGEAWIEWPEHFEIVINPATSTIHVSPLSLSSFGLAVVEKNAGGFRVKELKKGKGNYAFDWEASGVRKGKEDFQVIRDKQDGPQGG